MEKIDIDVNEHRRQTALFSDLIDIDSIVKERETNNTN